MRFVPIIAFQVAWIVSALAAAQGLAWPGVMASGLAFAAGLVLSGERRGLARLAFASAMIGIAAESGLAASGLVEYRAAWPHPQFAPVWLVALWIAFAVTLEQTRRVLGSSPLAKAIVLGAFFGPAAYVAGERLGALVIPEPRAFALAILGVIWALALAVLLALGAKR
jgi:hypothetical protein